LCTTFPSTVAALARRLWQASSFWEAEMNRKQESVSLDVYIERRSARAVLVENLKGEGVWVPISQIHYFERGVLEPGEDVEIWIPEWLAMEKELI